MWEYILASPRPQVAQGLAQYFNIPQLVEMYNEANNTSYRGQEDGWLKHEERGQCHIKTLDGMCGVMMAHKLTIRSEHIPHFYRLLEYMAQKGNYTYIMMSNIVGGERLATWKARGFESILSFRNRRTHNDVEVVIKQVPLPNATT